MKDLFLALGALALALLLCWWAERRARKLERRRLWARVLREMYERELSQSGYDITGEPGRSPDGAHRD